VVSPLRRYGASATLALAAVGFTSTVLSGSVDALGVAISAAIGVAAVGLSRRGLFPQTMSRAVAWLLFFPTAFASFFALTRCKFDPAIYALTFGAGLAHLRSSPRLIGWNWDIALGYPNPGESAKQIPPAEALARATKALRAHPGVHRDLHAVPHPSPGNCSSISRSWAVCCSDLRTRL